MEQEMLIKFIERRVTEAEHNEVMDWIESSPENRKEYARLRNLYAAVDFMASYSNAEKLYGGSLMLRKAVSWTLRIAAVLVIGAGLFAVGHFISDRNWTRHMAEDMIEISAPVGDIVPVTLPDGSSIILNGGSVIRFSKLFNKDERMVYLSGEGYFEVQENGLEFNVVYPMEDPLFKVAVLGTKFNISSYMEDDELVASLYDGSIKVMSLEKESEVMLEPNQMLRFSKADNECHVEEIKDLYRWMDKYLFADGEDIVSLARRLERIFDVKIIIDEDLIGNFSYKGALYGASLKHILDNMTYASPIRYKMEDNGRRVIIERNP